MVFEVDLDIILKKIVQNIDRLSGLDTDLVPCFIAYIVQLILPHRNISKFVLLVDEVVKVERMVSSKFYGGKELDITSYLREALLTKSILMEDGVALNVSLVISSLNIKPIGQTSSDREVVALVLPSGLNIKRVAIIHDRNIQG
jgi:hypothetical protein